MAAASEFSFPSPYDRTLYHKQKTAVEFRIMTASQRIREKTGWREDMKSDDITNIWREETINQGLKAEDFDCVMKQLKYFDNITALAAGSVDIGAVDGTWQGDKLVGEQLKREFMKAVDNLSDKRCKKDYDPGSDSLVINVIDPSLYCLFNDVTRVKLDAVPSLRYIGGGKKLDAPIQTLHCGSETKMLHYQLLPAEFHINATGQVKINSYINNVHPIHDGLLYSLIAKIFECFIPLFNGVLKDLLNLNSVPTHPAKKSKLERFIRGLSNFTKLKKPELALSTSSSSTFDLRGRDIQVIVKLKSIELTPDKYEFKAGEWHTEGIKEEHIVATGVYCFYSKNITQSQLNFRQHREQNQGSGSIVTSEDRLLAFPNVYQHRIDSFRLVDKTRPGFRKILVFFLVDPTEKITSTRDVPPQQMSWFNEELQKVPPFDRLDLHVVEHITSFLTWPMSRKVAEDYRLQLLLKRRTKKSVNRIIDEFDDVNRMRHYFMESLDVVID